MRQYVESVLEDYLRVHGNPSKGAAMAVTIAAEDLWRGENALEFYSSMDQRWFEERNLDKIKVIDNIAETVEVLYKNLDKVFT
jgi:hypothetical protein